MKPFLRLPAELAPLVIRPLNRPSLKSLRQTCRAVRAASTAQLFHTVRLLPDDQSCDRMEHLLADPRKRKAPRKFYLNTIETDLVRATSSESNAPLLMDDKDPHEVGEQPEAEWPARWDTLLARVREFENLRSAVLRFDRNYGAEASPWDTAYPQSPAFRFRALDAFFSMVASLKLPLKELGIRNLQVDNPRNEKTREIIANALPSLETLRLTIVSEYNTHAEERDIERPEQHRFYQELPSTWLAPAANSLRHLSLVGEDYFGFYPKLDLGGIHFPHLKSLSLGNYTFSDDTQIDWILSHAATLEEVYLDDCAILYDVGIREENLSRCAICTNETEFRRDESKYPEREFFRSWDRRWHHIFRTFAENLPNLRRFSMGSSVWDGEGAPFEKEEEIRVGLFPDRYLACYDGWGPSSYMTCLNDIPVEEGKARPECDEEDREALRMLLRKLGQTVPESYSIDYRRNVRDLISDPK